MTAQQPLISARNICLHTMGGRPLIRSLSFSLTRDKVAVVGRNGVGKSTLLDLLQGRTMPDAGRIVRRVEPHLVPQLLGHSARQCIDDALEAGICAMQLARECGHAGLAPPHILAAQRGLSGGELRKLHLVVAKLMRPQLLLLDEPTQDIDATGHGWLGDWVERWDEGLIVVSHDRALLRRFEHFFVVAESGCHHFGGTLEALDEHLQAQHVASEVRYARNLSTLDARERHNVKVGRRRERKKNVGRVHELDRAQSRARLNTRRGAAQVSQGRAAGIRAARINGARGWAKATRRALAVELPLSVLMPQLPTDDGDSTVALENVAVAREGRVLFDNVDLRIGRERIGVTGPNGSGKTTLTRLMTGQHGPTDGRARTRTERIGAIAQGATDWMDDDSLLSRLTMEASVDTERELAELVVAHKFPLALAARPLCSLSPGERVRAALICILQRSPVVELLILDEPTFGLDFVGLESLRRALAAWPGGLVVVSHDLEFLRSIRLDEQLVLDGSGGHTRVPIESTQHQHSHMLHIEKVPTTPLRQ